MKIGIAVTTTPKRIELLETCLKHISAYSCEHFLYVHNDEHYKGIAYSKNKCLEALMDAGCDYLFMFDDDCYPVKVGWEKVFIDSGLSHASLTYCEWGDGKPNKNKILKTYKGIDFFNNPCGMMLYFTRYCVEKVGGFNPDYKQYGLEHLGLSRRIYNAGLIPNPYVAPHGAMDYFYCLDQHKAVQSNVSMREKIKMITKVRNVYQRERSSKAFIDYRIID